MAKRATLIFATTLLLSASLAPNAYGSSHKRFSGVTENISTAENYWGFRHRFQHKSLGSPGGSVQAFEIQCGQTPTGDDRYINNNLLALLDPNSVPGARVEMLALYRCSEGVYYRETLAIAVAGFVEIARHAQSFSDVDVEHEYQVLHTHSSTQSCGSQPAAKAWFFFLDGVKFTCFGYQDYIQGTSAPHSYEGEYFMEVNDATQGAILARHHYLGSMAYSRTGAVDGTGWSITNFDSTRIDYPASGHGDTVAPRDWWHACFNQICSS